MHLPTLFKRTSTGALQSWSIRTDGNVILTKYGQVDGKIQETSDTVKEGKNVGRSNETTPAEQALAEAKGKWEKQVKKGYVQDQRKAEAGKDDVEGGVLPMLAHKFSEQAKKIKYPALAQPKFDGVRCIAIIKNGKATLWSRTRKPYTSVPHIVAALEKKFPNRDLVLDGELYNHDYHDNFDDLISLIRQLEPIDGHEVVQYHIYDIVNDEPNATRALMLADLGIGHDHPLMLVPTPMVNSEAELMAYHDICVEAGYEGCMVRNSAGKYVNKRSYDLQKVKKFVDAEFQIVGMEEGRGRLQGHIGAFICWTKDKKEFKAKMRGATSKLKEYYQNPRLWIDQFLTVQYQNLTPDGIPRFPVGKAIRNYE